MSELHVKGMSGDAPPPSPALAALVAQTTPVAMRRPWRTYGLVLGAMALYATLFLFVSHARADMAFLPRVSLVVSAFLWALVLVVASALALVPPRGQVLVDGVRAVRVSGVLLVVLVVGTVLVAVDAPGHSRAPTADAAAAWHCGRLALLGWLFVLVVTWRALRHAAVASPWQVGVAIGVAGGALTALLLLFRCAIGGPAHTLLGHVGGVVLVGVLGGVVGAWRR